jgi:hypothetical protein
MVDKDNPEVGYCFRYATMHRNGRPFIKKGQNRHLESFAGGVWGGSFPESAPPQEEKGLLWSDLSNE